MIVKTNPDEFQNYLSDASNYQGTAEAVYLPESERELIELIKKCHTGKTRITVSGNGTGLTGARVPEGGVVISLEKMNRIMECHESEQYLRVQPGVILKELQDYVEEKKLFYPPDPTERNCFIGATAATNSSGARGFKYGPTRNYVIGLRVVLPSGETLGIERGEIMASGFTFSFSTDQGTKYEFSIPRFEMPDTKNASGYYCRADMDLIDLFIGSEGTLGIITELKLQLLPAIENILSCVVFFYDEEDAMNFMNDVRAATASDAPVQKKNIAARGLEFFNKSALDFLRPDYPSIPPNACAVWLEQELPDREDEITAAWLQLILKHHGDADTAWLAVNDRDREKFKDFRHAISWKVNDYVARRGLRKVGTDVAVPLESLRPFYQWMIDLVEKSRLQYVVYGHFGNCHVHLNMLPEDQNDFMKAKNIYAEICREAIRRKGTVSAEHGIGKMKRDYLMMMYREQVIREMAGLKIVFDPGRILNIGNLFEEKYLR